MKKFGDSPVKGRRKRMAEMEEEDDRVIVKVIIIDHRLIYIYYKNRDTLITYPLSGSRSVQTGKTSREDSSTSSTPRERAYKSSRDSASTPSSPLMQMLWKSGMKLSERNG